MGDETPNTMNLDLNLGPIVHPSTDNELGSESLSNESVNAQDWLDGPVHRFMSHRARQRWRSMWRQVPVPPETRNIALELIGGSVLQTGEGSAASEERPAEVTKMCDNNNGYLEDEVSGKKEDSERGNGDDGSFFDCNICLDLAKDPVVTCCGHLYCWPCLYRWLHVHSDAKECPVCKGEVTIKTVTPIYGRANNTREPEEDSNLKIPLRPQARRIESWRQTIQNAAFAIPMEEIFRRLGSRFELSQVQPLNPDDPHESSERSNLLLNRILTSRGIRREQNIIVPQDDVVDLMQDPANSQVGERRRFSSLLLRRSESHRDTNASLTSALNSAVTSALNSAEVESYFHNNHVERNQEQPQPVDDRDSVSSIAAVIHSESQTVDTAVEIDSTVALSTSSSRRRNEASRVSDMDSGDSRALRRRRLN